MDFLRSDIIPVWLQNFKIKLWLSDYDMPCHLRKGGYRIEFKFARVIVHMLADKAYLSSGTSTFVKKVGIDLNTIVMYFTVFSEDCKIHRIQYVYLRLFQESGSTKLYLSLQKVWDARDDKCVFFTISLILRCFAFPFHRRTRISFSCLNFAVNVSSLNFY